MNKTNKKTSSLKLELASFVNTELTLIDHGKENIRKN